MVSITPYCVLVHLDGNLYSVHLRRQGSQCQGRRDRLLQAFDLQHGYALTIHQAQGFTLASGILIFQPFCPLGWGYTAFARFRKTASSEKVFHTETVYDYYVGARNYWQVIFLRLVYASGGPCVLVSCFWWPRLVFHIVWPKRNGRASESTPLSSAALCGPSEAGHSGKAAQGWEAQFHRPQLHKNTCQENLESRVSEAPLCCALRTSRGLAFLRGSSVSLPRMGEVRSGPELSKSQMKLCIGELFLEAQAGFPDFLAQAERPRFGIHSNRLFRALRTKRGWAFWRGNPVSLLRIREMHNSPEFNQFQMKLCIWELFVSECQCWVSRLSGPIRTAALRNPLQSALLRCGNQAGLCNLAGGRKVYEFQWH